MLIYKEMTYTEWQDLRKRTEAALSVDTKEYYSLVKLFSEWTCSQSAIDQFSRGEPERYIGRLRDVLKKLKDKEKYPALITVDGGLKKRISVFHLPTSTMAQIPGTPVPEKQRLKFRKTGLVFQDMKTIGRIYRMLCGVKETKTW